MTDRFTATYSPDDDKLRLYAASRLEPELYARVKAAGFRWAPKQELFVAPCWTPEREDLLLELAGEVGDEDASLVDRAEERADRFEGYQERRLEDAHRAKAAVDAIADNIPLGQPILVGHHSEKHARRDAERIRSGMQRAVRLWDTAQYWKGRALGALRHAKYKQMPQVRHRRIKTLSADKRRADRHRVELDRWAAFWANPDLTVEAALRVMQFYDDAVEGLKSGKSDFAQVVAQKSQHYALAIARSDRWLAHYDNRIAYETAMLDEQVGAGEVGTGMAGRFDVAVGGKIFDGREWLVVLKVNKVAGGDIVNSVSTTAPRAVHWTNKWNYPVEKIVDYRPPTPEDVARVKAATKLPPLCNYPGEGFKEMTEAEWKRVSRASDMSHIRPIEATTLAGRHRARFTMLPGWKRAQVFVTDIKRVDPPGPMDEGPRAELSGPTRPEGTNLAAFVTVTGSGQITEKTRDALEAIVAQGFEHLRQAAKKPVEVVVVPNLFPTPAPVADRVVSLLGIEPGDRVLEPSAGTGALIDAIVRAGAQPVTIDAVEASPELAQRLIQRAPYPHLFVRCGDFLEMDVGHLGDIGRFDKILMNPPFDHGSDVKHVEHALSMLKSGGRLVAVMAYGRRQIEWIKGRDDAEQWGPLDPGTFEGTQVRAMIAVFNKE
jgi:phospholipid N-methyltransferase